MSFNFLFGRVFEATFEGDTNVESETAKSIIYKILERTGTYWKKLEYSEKNWNILRRSENSLKLSSTEKLQEKKFKSSVNRIAI